MTGGPLPSLLLLHPVHHRCDDRARNVCGIERGYIGKTEVYNDVANWAYAELPKALCPDTTARSFVVKTGADLREVLSQP